MSAAAASAAAAGAVWSCCVGCLALPIQLQLDRTRAPVKWRGSHKGRTRGGSCTSGLVMAQASSTPHPAAVVCCSASVSWSLQGGRGEGHEASESAWAPAANCGA